MLARRLDDQVNVVALHRIVHDAEFPALARLAKAPTELRDEPSRAQRGKSIAHANGHVSRMLPSDRFPPNMVDATRTARPSGPGSRTTPALGLALEVERELRRSSHACLNLGYVLRPRAGDSSVERGWSDPHQAVQDQECELGSRRGRLGNGAERSATEAGRLQGCVRIMGAYCAGKVSREVLGAASRGRSSTYVISILRWLEQALGRLP